MQFSLVVFDGMLAPYDQLAISQLKMLLTASYVYVDQS